MTGVLFEVSQSMADTSQVRETTLKLEQGVKGLFTSEQYANYLRTF